MTEIEVSIWAAILTLSFLLIIWALCCRNIDNQSTDRVRFSSPNMLSTFACHVKRMNPKDEKMYLRLRCRNEIQRLLISLAIFCYFHECCSWHGHSKSSSTRRADEYALSQDLLQKSIMAGVIDSDSQVAGSLPSGSSGVNLGTPTTSDAIEDSDSQPTSGEKVLNANTNGALSLILQDKAINYLNLELPSKWCLDSGSRKINLWQFSPRCQSKRAGGEWKIEPDNCS